MSTSPSLPAQSQTDQKPTIKEQVVYIPVGSMVEVRMRSNEKTRGLMGEASQQGFALQVMRNQKMETMTIPFDDTKGAKRVNSLQPDSKAVVAGKTTGMVVLGVLVVIGVVAVAALVIVAASGG